MLLAWCISTAQALVPVPRLTARVTDQTGTLAPDQVRRLEQRLQSFEAVKGSQVAVLIVPTTQPEAIEPYALRVVEAWKLGRRNVDDGALLIVAKNDRTLRIEVGYGLEGALPDAIAKRIIEEIIVPKFRAGDFAGGIEAGLEQIIKVIEGEPLPEPKRPSSTSSPSTPDNLVLLVIFLFMFGNVLRTWLGRFLGGTVGGGLAAVLLWGFTGLLVLGLLVGLLVFVLILLGGKSGGRSGGGWSAGGGSYRGGGGGFRSGGFSGGGGSFGGGGASGRW
jgi:uncharacterized protein